jgi:hypothetical protein
MFPLKNRNTTSFGASHHLIFLTVLQFYKKIKKKSNLNKFFILNEQNIIQENFKTISMEMHLTKFARQVGTEHQINQSEQKNQKKVCLYMYISYLAEPKIHMGPRNITELTDIMSVLKTDTTDTARRLLEKIGSLDPKSLTIYWNTK